jgi:hypothetical protein
MDIIVKNELDIFLKKIELQNNVRESWIKKNLTSLYNYFIHREGNSFSEKVYLYKFDKKVCKSCGSETKFLSYKRGYRDFCSKICSNNDSELIRKKSENFKITSLKNWGVDSPSKSEAVKERTRLSNIEKWGVDSPSKSEVVKERTRLSNIEKWGVDNPSKSEVVKEKKKNTTLKNWGVDNPFKSSEIKEKIKLKNLENLGVSHPLKSDSIKNKIKETNLKNWGVDNFTKSDVYKELIFEKYRSSSIKTNLNSDNNYHQYIGLGVHELKCDCGLSHEYQTNSHLYHARKKLNNKQCTICFPVGDISSFKELELLEYIQSIYSGSIIQSHRDGLEIDIYLPLLKIGFEFNGLYWHSELFKNKNYHLDKTKYFQQRGIRIIHIWEDDWDFRKEIVKSQISNWLGLTENRIFARDCNISEIDSIDEYRDFLENNHIQGYTSASVRIGLYHNGELVSLMTFDHFEGRKLMSSNEWNLSRFCNKLGYNIVGGASKLLKYFINNHNAERIISFADKSWSNGGLYEKLGFNIKSISYPNYSYLIDKKRSNKQKWKKSNLIKMGFDEKLSESKIMEDNFGAYKVFDCGQIKFELLI